MNTEDAEQQTEPELIHVSLPARLRNYLLAGILVTAPLGITIYLVWLFLQFMDELVIQLIPAQYNPNEYLQFSVPGIGLLISIVFFILVGWAARNFVGRMVISVYEYVITHVPVIKNIYSAIKQIAETMMTSQSKAFREVVLLQYPRAGIWTLGFVTSRVQGEVQRRTDATHIGVFVPTGPNPTSGFLLFVPEQEVIPMKMSVEEAIKMVVSTGLIVPPEPVV